LTIMPGKKKSFLVLLLAGLIARSVHSESFEHWQNPHYIADSFVEIALKNEYAPGMSVVRKWQQPVRYFFDHRVPDQTLHEELTVMHLNHLAQITGLDFQPVPNRQAANLFIVFSTEQALKQELVKDFDISKAQAREQLFRHSVCLARFKVHSDFSIAKAWVIIPVDRARAHAKLLACIVEELTQVMGLPNDSEKVYPSIFNDKTYHDLLTGLDYLLLKLLYQPSILPGMNQQQVRPLILKQLALFQQQQLIRQAETRVRDGALYEFY
jgi:hypothetical protein